ncbi:MAG: hypothetical protein M0P69_03130 [Bacteroidales bacterium]|nr:hypothetical protein [Bacteroidales bacterium]
MYRHIAREIARALVESERRQGMSGWQVEVEREHKRQAAEKKREEHFKRMFGFYPDGRR